MITVCSPDYLPSIPFWASVLQSQKVYLDPSAQYVRQSGHNRARIRTPDGPHWLTIPVARGQLGKAIGETAVSSEGAWWRLHRKTFQYNYGGTPFFEHLMPVLEPHLRAGASVLSEITVPLILNLADWTGLAGRVEPLAGSRPELGPVVRTHPPVSVAPYRQAFDGFVPDLSFVDLLFNYGPAAVQHLEASLAHATD